MDNMDSINELNKIIYQLRMKIFDLMYNEAWRCAGLDTMKLVQIERLRTTADELTRQRNREIKRIYVFNSAYRPMTGRPKPHPIGGILTFPKLKISAIVIGKNSTTFKMTPSWFKCDDESKALKNIIYPYGTTKHRPFDTIARYRAIIKKSNNFKNQPLIINEGSIETLILVLDAFAQRFGGQLSFTTNHLSFEESTHRIACGIANLGSTHLLANAHISSANFALIVNINYDELSKSEEKMQSFILSFVNAIAKDLSCDNDYIRVVSIVKSTKRQGKAEINLVITTPDKTKTEDLAEILQSHAYSGFEDNTILRRIEPDDYQIKWMPVLSYLQLQPMDFDSKYNFDYTQKDLPETQTRGNLPIGWYRHGLKVDNKYKDTPVWNGSSNSPDEWPVAYHGTRSHAVKSITDEGLLTSNTVRDAMLKEAIEQMGVAVNQPGLYVTTHCNGGSHPYYTEKFDVPTAPGKTEAFQVVFQCRVRPNAFTRHTTPVKVGEAWRLVDPDSVRPYGILLKNANTKLSCEEDQN